MGPVQRGLPLSSALPRNWPIIVLDIKDCFFSISLYHKDTVRFAFTVPSQNHAEPDKRFEWTVLPQGMANSPTMCQLYVDTALKGVGATQAPGYLASRVARHPQGPTRDFPTRS